MNVIQMKLEPDETIAFLGDLHLDNRSVDSRVDDLMQTAKDKLWDILGKCQERKVRALFLEGDVFNRIQVSHEAINEFGSIFMEFKNAGIRIFTILGNHDILRNAYDNFQKAPLQTMITFGIIEHIHLENRVLINGKVLITPVDYFEYPTKAEPKAGCNILLAHMFYNQSAMMADERHNLSKEVVESLGYDFVFLGHDHEEYKMAQAGKSIVVRTGSLLRGTAHIYNFTRKPCFTVLTDLSDIRKETLERVEISHREFKEVASSYVLNKKSMSTITGLKDVLSNLAERLAEGTETESDRIFEILQTDDSLPAECRMLIMKYLSEV